MSDEVADETDASALPPATKFDQTVVDLRPGRDHHRAAGKFAVAEGQEQAGTAVGFLLIIHPQGKRPPAKPRQADEMANLSGQASLIRESIVRQFLNLQESSLRELQQ